jgi:hypothetical protein
MLLKAKKWRTKSDDLPEIPPVPLIIQRIVPRRWTHLSNTGCQLVRTCPRCLDILAHGPSGTLHVAEVEVRATPITVSIYVPPGDGHVNAGRVGNSHVFGKVLHTFSEVF